MQAMTVEQFGRLRRRDFKNSAVTDEIIIALRDREQFAQIIGESTLDACLVKLAIQEERLQRFDLLYKTLVTFKDFPTAGNWTAHLEVLKAVEEYEQSLEVQKESADV